MFFSGELELYDEIIANRIKGTQAWHMMIMIYGSIKKEENQYIF